MREEIIAKLSDILVYLDSQRLHVAAAHVSTAIDLLSTTADVTGSTGKPSEDFLDD